MQQIDFIFYLVDTPTGLCYYKDGAGRTMKTPITNTNIDSHLKSSPGKWMDQVLTFERNATYYGINRSYSEPLLFVKQSAAMVRELYYAGIGTETPLTLVVYKFNPSGTPATYNLYYSGQLDLTTSTDTITEGFECSLMEGGILALIKSYEGRIFEIPCDGSIPENVKVNIDGWLLPDVFNYQFTPVLNSFLSSYTSVAAFYEGNEGDNFGIVHQDPQLVNFGGGGTTAPWALTNDYLFYSTQDIDVEVEGTITFGGSIATGENYIGYANMFLAKSSSVFEFNGTPFISNTIPLIPDVSGLVTDRDPTNNIGNYIVLKQQTTFTFKKTISLKAYEKLFMIFNQEYLGGYVKIISGNFQLKFNSAPIATRPWCVTWFDLGKLLLQNICLAASTTNQTFNYDFKSDLLLANLNLLITGGDPLRASVDPDYNKFFNANNIGSQPISGLLIEYGPVIKTSLKEFFTAVNCMFCAALGNETIDGKEYLFVEKRQYVFNPTDNVMSIGEVANMKFAYMKEFAITGFKIGYQPPSLDQKAGKYEPNTTAEWSFGNNTAVSNIMDIVSPYNASPVLIQRLISGVGTPTTSTTNNDSDNSVFIINSDPTIKSKDFQSFDFTSLVTDFNLSTNTNIRLIANNAMQGVAMDTVNGSYLSLNNDSSIFVLADPALDGTQIKDITGACSGYFLGNPANPSLGLPIDSITLELWIAGFLYYDQTFPATGASTTFNFAPPTLTRNIHTGDAIYIKIKTSLNASGLIENGSIKVTETDGTTPYWSTSGSNIQINPGTASSLVPLPNVTGPTVNANGVPVNSSNIPIVSWGFQYYQFNSILSDSDFEYSFSVSQIIQVASTQTFEYFLYKNGNVVLSQSGTYTQTSVFQNHGYETLEVGDIFYLLASVTALNMQVTVANVTFRSMINVNGLKRVNYDYLADLPNLAYLTKDANGNPIYRSDIAGAPFNIEFLTPKRIFERWYPFFASILYAAPLKSILFCSLSKNQYLVTSFQGKIYAENQNVSRASMGDGYFLPFLMTSNVETSDTFDEAQTGAANSCVALTFNGFSAKSFPQKLSQKPAFNETQSWETIAAWGTDLTQLFNLEYAKLNDSDMLNNTIKVSGLCSLKFVPKGQTLDPKYRTPDPDLFLLKDTITGWASQPSYSNPWYVNNPIPLQVFAKGLAPVSVQLFDCCGNPIGDNIELTLKTSAGVPSTIGLWEGSIPLTSVDPGSYYVELYGGDEAVILISEPIDVRAVDATDRVLLFEFTHSENKQFFITDTGFTGAFYVSGFDDNRSMTTLTYAVYVDQPQDITLLNAIPYRTRTLQIGAGPGVPDYVIEKLIALMGLDTVFIEGIQYSIDQGSKWEAVTPVVGNPFRYWKTTIRLAKNNDGISVTAAGAVDDTTITLTLDAAGVGPNSNNDANNNEPNIIELEITT